MNCTTGIFWWGQLFCRLLKRLTMAFTSTVQRKIWLNMNIGFYLYSPKYFFFFFWSCVYLCCPDLIYIAKFYSGILLLSNLLCSCLFLLLKTTFEDVFPAEATSIEEYLQQVSFMQFSLILSSLADKFYSRSYWVIYEMLAEISISYFLLLEDLAGSVLLVVWLFIYVLCCC